MQPIHCAASNGQPEVVVQLIEQFGVDPKEKADVIIIVKLILFHLMTTSY